MSFLFRNIFSPDDSEFEGSPENGVPGGFSSPGEVPQGRGNLEPGKTTVERGQTFLASELLPLIPTAIVADSGIPMEKEILVPVPADGSLDVKLSTLYQLCPELFAAEITPLNDSVLTLPPRVGATPPVTAQSKALAASGIFFKPEANAEAGSGFWSPVTPASPSSSSPPPGKGVAPANPFAAEDISAKNAFAAPATSGPAPSTMLGKMPGGFELPLVGGAGKAFGAGPAGAPLEANAAAPAPGMFGFGAAPTAKSEGEVPAAGNPFESDKGFATLFTKQAEHDASIPPPGGPFGAPAKAPEIEGVWGAMFRGEAKDLSAEPGPDFEGIGNLLSQTKKPAEPQGLAMPSAPPPAAPVEMTAPAAGGFAKGFNAYASPAASEAVPPAPSIEVGCAATASLEAVFAVAASPAAPAAAASAAAPVEDVSASGIVASTSPEPVVEPVMAPAAAVTSSAPASDDEDLRDLEMRAIFSTSERFNLSMVARKVVGLPGINSCSLSTPGKIVHASRRDETRLGNEAREMIATLRSLAKLTGLPEARTFTLQTDRGIVSLFLEGDCCVTVNQEAAAFPAGVREKLILIARSIGKLRD